MFRRSKFAALIWLLAIALLPVRMANAHLHMCLDGQEPRAALHVTDVPMHDGTEDESGHNDRDVKLSAALSITKANTLDDTPLPLLETYVLAIVLPVERSVAPPVFVQIPDLTPAFDLRPPSRGPPC
ncbi:hypothetical protein HNQ60_003856 [Povalibacter uvarum]|uniref:Uncharacterized protein n=1 Tax=Povalibacter uvarum TaxID=732238 RepID=A0A841HRN2_9GAMM|nr:hypothetical protein [Povalibacter uvarum]MBB6094969.1 hypothetical protein [Povalibacter uvarum]